MPALGGILSRGLAAALWLVVTTSGCVQQAVLENDVRNAQWKARVLATQVDLRLAEAAAAAELVELEALYQRAPDDARVTALLTDGYARLADGFIEGERLAAVVAGDDAEAAAQQQRQTDARARSAYYRQQMGKQAGDSAAQPGLPLLAPANDACHKRERARYETELSALLSASAQQPEQRLQLALAQRQARFWLAPKLSQRCGF